MDWDTDKQTRAFGKALEWAVTPSLCYRLHLTANYNFLVYPSLGSIFLSSEDQMQADALPYGRAESQEKAKQMSISKIGSFSAVAASSK